MTSVYFTTWVIVWNSGSCVRVESFPVNQVIADNAAEGARLAPSVDIILADPAIPPNEKVGGK